MSYAPPPSALHPAAARWRAITLAALFLGYVGYYICRVNLAVSTPLILDEMQDQGITKEHLGLVASAGLFAYALGKIISGLLADFLGGRALFLAGMIGSVAATAVFGLHAGLAFFVGLWFTNRFFQSMGWVALVKTVSRWFPARRHATVMGWLSTSFLIGDAFGKWYLGAFIKIGERAADASRWKLLADWRSVFFISAATLAVITVVVSRMLKSSPGDVGVEEPPANPANVFGAKGNAAKPENVRSLLRPLLASRLFWTICGMNIGLTLIRESFNFWTPTIFREAVGMSAGRAAQYSSLFPLVGAVAAVMAGMLSDWWGGKHGRVLAPCLLLLVLAMSGLAMFDLQGRPLLASLLLAAVAFFLLAPYSYLAGVMALDLGGKQGSSSAAGLIDSAGYVGAILSGVAVGKLAEDFGWNKTVGCLAVVAAATCALGVWYWFKQERAPAKAQ